MQRAWNAAQTNGDDLYLDAAALGLHAIYSGVERVLQLIAERIDHEDLPGASWHQALLLRAAQETPTRPAVISEETRAALEPYRGFRHVVRNVYAFRLDAARMAPLVEGLPDLARRLEEELAAFADLLDASAN